MAEFNPPLNLINDPDYTRKSQPISVPDPIKPTGRAGNQILPQGVKEGDRSGEYAGKARAAEIQADAVSSSLWSDLFASAAKGVDLLVKTGDTMIKKDIENQVYSQANAEREQYTEALETMAGRPGGVNSIMQYADGGENVPGELKNLPRQVESLAGANSAGKISHTMYIGRLNALAKDLRSRYPGYRQYIDQQFASVTGMNPANAYIESLTKDLNAAAANQRTERGKIDSLIIDQMKDGNPTAIVAWQMYQTGQADEIKVMKMLTPWIAQKADIERRKLIRSEAELRNEDVSRIAEDDFTLSVTRKINNTIDTFQWGAGANTQQGLDKIISDAASGKTNEQTNIAIAARLRSVKADLVREMTSEAAQRGPNGTNAIQQQLKDKGAGVSRIITERMSNLFDPYIDALEKGEYGLAKVSANRIKSMSNDGTVAVFNHPTLGPKVKAVDLLRRVAGDSAVSTVANRIIAGNDFPENLHSFFTEYMSGAASQPGKTTGGAPITIKDAFQQAKEQKINNPRMNQKMINDSVGILIDPKNSPQIKENIAMSLFSPENRGFLNLVNSDGRTADGRIIPGKYYTFRQLTSPEVTSTIEKLGKANPKILDDYKDWTQMTFRDLFNKTLVDLSEYQGFRGITVSWNSDTKKINVNDSIFSKGPSDSEYSPTERLMAQQRLAGMQERIRLVNLGLASLAETAPMFNTEVENYLLSTMLQAGYQLSESSQGFPDQLMKSIISAKMQRERTQKGQEELSKSRDFLSREVGGR